jgi:hypothetical protein
VADQSVKIRLRPADRQRIELMRETLGISMSDIVRLGLVALSRQMGYEKELPDDFLRKK